MDMPHCPNCNSAKVIPVVYGYPGKELDEMAGRGEIILGGCCVNDSQPTCRCFACGHAWREEEGGAIGSDDIADSAS